MSYLGAVVSGVVTTGAMVYNCCNKTMLPQVAQVGAIITGTVTTVASSVTLYQGVQYLSQGCQNMCYSASNLSLLLSAGRATEPGFAGSAALNEMMQCGEKLEADMTSQDRNCQGYEDNTFMGLQVLVPAAILSYICVKQIFRKQIEKAHPN